MELPMIVFTGIAVVLSAAMAAMVGYLLMLTLAAFLAPRRTPPGSAAPRHRFLLLIPAHNEERLLPSLMESLSRLDYPAHLYAIHVVADNCADRTAELAAQAGAMVHERHDLELRGKPYALRWALGRIWASDTPHDAIVILDADTVISANFLRVMDARLARGERAIQAYYAVRNPEQSWSASLRAVALASLNYLRPQGRQTLGGSTVLKGNGMVFAAEIARRYEWPVSLTEDIEYHTALILGGERVMFAPDAVVWAEMPATLKAAQSQNARWERGRLQMVRQYVPRLLGAAARRRSLLLLDAAVEQIIPPLSVVAAGSLLSVVLAALAGSPAAVVLSLFAMIGLCVYVLAGLVLASVPRRVYQSLLYVPVFVLWKLGLYLRVLARPGGEEWVRTARNDL
jgi:1,2-diacylglycerol 3-beta-glucosyltransferase